MQVLDISDNGVSALPEDLPASLVKFLASKYSERRIVSIDGIFSQKQVILLAHQHQFRCPGLSGRTRPQPQPIRVSGFPMNRLSILHVRELPNSIGGLATLKILFLNDNALEVRF